MANLCAEDSFYLIGSHFSIFNDIMQKASGNHSAIAAQAAKQSGNGNRMRDIRLTRGSLLAFMKLIGKFKSAAD